MTSSEQIEASKIFVWGQIGERLKKLDSERMLCIAQKNPHHALSVQANIEISEIIQLILSMPKAFKEMPDDLKKKIIDTVKTHNHLDTTFRQINKYFQEFPDNLSTGSLIMGETESKKAWLKTIYGGSKSESD